MTPTVVDIVIPVFNAAKTLAETLESVLMQNGVASIVVIDDGSTDGSSSIAKRYEPLVNVLEGPNQGVSIARNRGVAETSSQWIIFLDSDDLLMPETVSRRIDIALGGEADVIVSDWVDLSDVCGVLGSPKTIDWYALEDDAEVAMGALTWAPPAAMMFRRSIVEKIGGFHEGLPVIQDARFLFDAVRCGARFAHAPHVGACYRIAPNPLSRRDRGHFWTDVLRNGQQIEAIWRSDGELSKARLESLFGIYNASRGLFSARRSEFFVAVAALTDLNLEIPLHAKVAGRLAKLLGLTAAQFLLSVVGRG